MLLKSSEANFPPVGPMMDVFCCTRIDPKTKAICGCFRWKAIASRCRFLHTEFNELDGHFSPDMRWIAYVSDESGSNEICVRGFSQTSGASSVTSGKWLVSRGAERDLDGEEMAKSCTIALRMER